MTEEEFAEARATDDKLHDPPILDPEADQMGPELRSQIVSLFVHQRHGRCGAPSTRWKQVGRCVYCECGERLYQGRIP